ncbi:MAG: hypothetical protein JSR39_01335 [Verrucomicrobia bacterium]|nr:hypothetical protein [Verrucomicrobiota bacterium]
MASALEAIRSGLTSLFWGDTSKAQLPPKTAEDVFKENILNIAAMSYIDHQYEKGCIAACVQAIGADFERLEFPLSLADRKMIETHATNFERAVADTPHLYSEEAVKIKSQFKQAYCLFLEKQWGAAAAKSFYTIPSIRNEAERTAAAQNWTEHFFAGLCFFNRLENHAPVVVADFVARIVDRSTPALHTFCHEKMQQNMAAMKKRAEHDPISFSKIMDEVVAKAEIDPSSLSDQEREYVEFAENIAGCVTQHWPNVDKKIDLMKQCVWHGFTLQQQHWSIVGTEVSAKLFASAFAEKV